MATIADRGFAPDHRLDRTFFAAFVAVCWIGVLLGFYPASGARIMGRADYVAPLILHVHAAAFTGWLLLLTSQVVLIRRQRHDLHMALGIVGILLVPVMAYSAIAAELYSQRFYIQRNEDGLDFFVLPIFYVLAFTGFATAAFLFARHCSASHKRLLLIATTVIVGAAYTRFWGVALTEAFGDAYWGMIVNTFTGTNLILAAAVGYDVVTRGRPHRVYMVGVPIILAGELLCSWIYHQPWWPPLSRQLIEIRLPLSY